MRRLRAGEVPFMGRTVRRDRQPALFWGVWLAEHHVLGWCTVAFFGLVTALVRAIF